MTEAVVSPVESRRDRRQFIDLPWSLYRTDPNWIPPLRWNQSQLLGFHRHPFHDNAELQCFLARRGGEVCGRVAAILNRVHNEHYGEQRGFFGYFESIDDQVVSSRLFDAVKQWFASRDVRAIRGPTNPSMNYECGLLIEGFDSPPTFMMTYNPPYYPRLIEASGFRKTHDLLAYAGYIDQLPELQERLRPVVEQVREHFDVQIRGMDRSRFLDDVYLFFDLYNRAMVTTWGFVPLPQNEKRHLGSSLKSLLVPELALVADVDGKPAGTILGLLDYNPRIKEIDGRLLPFGFLKLLRNRRGMKRLRVISINVLPEFQRWGLGLLLMSALVPKALELGIQEAEFSWISEANDLARQGLRKGGAVHIKTYRLYDYEAAMPDGG